MNNRRTYDILIAGTGFLGTLLGMIARRLGYSVLLLEKGTHPRFVIGESSTPFTNLLLQEIARDYDLDSIAPLCEWGSWQRQLPQIPCGLKRGFSFYHHKLDHPFEPSPRRCNQLLVAASPRDEIADTHWYRPGFDHYLLQEACAMGCDYVDQASIQSLQETSEGINLTFLRSGSEQQVGARLLVDGTGPRGVLRQLGKDQDNDFEGFPLTQGLYTHFVGVNRFTDVCDSQFGQVPPFPPDDAALHHVFKGGWIWVLRFNNGITSAGVAALDPVAKDFGLERGRAGWEALLDRLPSVKAQFEGSEAVAPFVHANPLPFRRRAVCGPHWVRLPSSVGFVDPLFSTGFALGLLGLQRLARVLQARKQPAAAAIAWDFNDYETATLADLDWAAKLVRSQDLSMRDPELFNRLSLIYFAAASYSETVTRLGLKHLCGDGFLLRSIDAFRNQVLVCLSQMERFLGSSRHEQDRIDIIGSLDAILSGYDLIGLAQFDRNNWYPVLGEDLRCSRHKIGASATAVESFLQAVGM